MDEETKHEYWRIRASIGRPVSQEAWIKNRDSRYPGYTAIINEYGKWSSFRAACGDIEFVMNSMSREPENISCNYDGIMIHYTESEYARLHNIKDLKYVETKNI